MSEVKMPEDLESQPIYVVLEGSPAWDVMLRICMNAELHPGEVIPASQKEIDSLREDLITVRMKRAS